MRLNHKNKAPIIYLVGIPLMFVLLSLAFSKDIGYSIDKENDFNTYLKTLPTNYVKALSKTKVSDSTFFYSRMDGKAIRELLIFKTFPSDIELKTDFDIKLYPSPENHASFKDQIINLSIINDAVKFNYIGKTFGVFRIVLPYIDFDKIEIKKRLLNRTDKAWGAIIDKPFKPLRRNLGLSITINKNEVSMTPNTYSLLFSKVLEFYEINFLPYTYQLENESLVHTNLSLDKFALERELTIARVEVVADFWKLVNKKDNALSKHIVFKGIHKDKANELLERYLKSDSKLEVIFNINKLAIFNALKNVFTFGCDNHMYFLYNSTDNLIEPFYENSGCLGQMAKSLARPLLEDANYIETYVKVLNNVSQLNINDIFIKGNEKLQQELALINMYNPKNIFDYDILQINQRVIKKSLNPSTLILSELISIDAKKIIMSVNNTSIFPVDIIGLNYGSNKEIAKLNPTKQILSYGKDTIIIELPRSFENLFVNKKKKATGFELARHIYDLNITYSISGLYEKQLSTIAPYEQQETVDNDLFRKKSAIYNHKHIVVNNEKGIITFSKDSVVISSALIIPKGYVFELKAGSVIDLINEAKIISYSPLHFVGAINNPISIFSSDKKGQGLLVLSEGKQSYLKFVDFNHLSNPEHGSWNLTGAVTFYESPAILENVSIANNRCEDALNISRTHFTMNNCNISNTQSDAFDGDFVKGTISECTFNNLGNDAIDISGSDLIIKKVFIAYAGDKGLSAGEDSKMTIDNVKISDSEIAIAGKDFSIIEANELFIINTKLGFTAFQKKPEFGPSKITVTGIIMEGVETDFLIESSSTLLVDGKKIETTQNVKDRMYGIEFGVSSEETRNNQ